MRYLRQTALASALALGMGTAAQAEVIALSQADEAQMATVQDPMVAEFGERYIIRYAAPEATGPSSGVGLMGAGSVGGISLQGEAAMLSMAGGHVALTLESENAIAAYLPSDLVKRLAAQPNVVLVEADPRRYMQGTTPYGITQAQADQVSDANAGNQTVCVIDSGLDGNHRDFNFNRITGTNDSGTGNWFQDGSGHGTHVAGTIAAVANGVDVVGVLPGGTVNLHIVKVFGNNGAWAYSSTLINAANTCAQNGASVINMSLGGGRASQTEGNAFQNLLNNGVLSIAAAGNSGNSTMSYPASYDAVVSVAAVDQNANRASFSQFNSQVEISAAGVQVLSTRSGGGTTRMSGTSMASPHVAGVAALVWSHFPSCTASQIRNALNTTALDLGTPGRNNQYGYGLVQAKDAYDWINANGCDGSGGGSPDPDPEPPAGGELTNGQAVSNLSAGQDSQVRYFIDVPEGATDLRIATSGGTGDVDLYVRRGSEPTLSQYDCRPYRNGNNETCSSAEPQAGRYHILLHGYRAYSGVELIGEFEAPTGGGNFFENPNRVNIPDATWRGPGQASSSIDVNRSGDSGTFTVDVDIRHTYRGDLEIRVIAPNGASATLKERNGSDGANNVIESWTLNGGTINSQGTWRLEVTDHYRGDVGYINSWSLTFD